MTTRLLCAAAAALVALAGAASAWADCAPTDIRSDISGRWRDDRGNLRWPTSDWTGGIVTTVVLPPGMVIDRFGCEAGRDFNPQGTAFPARALPYVCATTPYRSYRVVKPLVVWSGKVPAWFDQKGGGTQFHTTATAAQLVADGSIEVTEIERPACG